MPSYSPELIQTMRAALDEVMTKIPADQATPAAKAFLAEFILKAAAQGQTTYDGLLAAASKQISTVLQMLT
jgi:N-acetylglucosamine kinase-like BadF-type ATPase